MRLTEKQLNLFWRTWGRACRTQGWTRQKGMSVTEISQKRHDMLMSLGFRSLTEVDPTSGFDRVLARTRVLADQISGALDEVDEHLGDRRRLHQKVRDQMRCLALYMPHNAVARYVHTICAAKFEHRNGLSRTWEELDHAPRSIGFVGNVERFKPSELMELVMTLSARLNGRRGFRAKAQHSMHEMLTSAGVPCRCSSCHIPTAAPQETPAAPAEIPAPELTSDPF